jgi:hypothetical protein
VGNLHPNQATSRKVRIRAFIGIFLLLGLISLVLGLAFVLIFIGIYGLVIFITPYSHRIRHLVEFFVCADLSVLDRPIRTTPTMTLLTSLILVVIRIGCIVIGVLMLHGMGFNEQNIIWLILHH